MKKNIAVISTIIIIALLLFISVHQHIFVKRRAPGNIVQRNETQNTEVDRNVFESEIDFPSDDKIFNDITATLLEEIEEELIENARFCLGFINDDNIPDILFSKGGGTGDGVGIFILKNGKLNLVKSKLKDAPYDGRMFGQSGHIEYIPKKNRIYASYGGTAFCPEFIDVKNGECTTVCALTEWHNTYHLGEEEISQLRFYDLFDAYYNDGAEYVEADYDNMISISVENVKKAYAEVRDSYSNVVKMYAIDGEIKNVASENVETWKKDGWYETPVRTMYKIDGSSAIAPGEELLKWVNDGWHTRNHIQMFSPHNESKEVPLQNIEESKRSGWYEYPVIELYSKDGKSTIVPLEEQEKWMINGWSAEPPRMPQYTDARVPFATYDGVTGAPYLGEDGVVYKYEFRSVEEFSGYTDYLINNEGWTLHKYEADTKKYPIFKVSLMKDYKMIQVVAWVSQNEVWIFI